MAPRARPQSPPCVRWLFGSRPTVLTTARKSPSRSPRFSPSPRVVPVSQWQAVKARRLLAALLRIGWVVAWQRGSHRRLSRPGWANYTFAFHDGEEVGPALLTQIAKKTGLRPDDL